MDREDRVKTAVSKLPVGWSLNKTYKPWEHDLAPLEERVPIEHALAMTNNPNNRPDYGHNDGDGEVADDELPLIPTMEEEDTDED